MLDAWRYLIPDIPDSFDWVTYAVLLGILCLGIYSWLKSRREARERPDAVVRKLTWGIGGPTVCLIYYTGGGFSEMWATEHAKSLSYALPLYCRVYRQVYGDHHQIFSAGDDPIIHHIEVSHNLDPGENGATKLYPDGAVISLRAFQSHHDTGAWGWELRNYVRHYEANIHSGGPAEFEPVRRGDEEAEMFSTAYRKRP